MELQWKGEKRVAVTGLRHALGDVGPFRGLELRLGYSIPTRPWSGRKDFRWAESRDWVCVKRFDHVDALGDIGRGTLLFLGWITPSFTTSRTSTDVTFDPSDEEDCICGGTSPL